MFVHVLVVLNGPLVDDLQSCEVNFGHIQYLEWHHQLLEASSLYLLLYLLVFNTPWTALHVQQYNDGHHPRYWSVHIFDKSARAQGDTYHCIVVSSLRHTLPPPPTDPTLPPTAHQKTRTTHWSRMDIQNNRNNPRYNPLHRQHILLHRMEKLYSRRLPPTCMVCTNPRSTNCKRLHRPPSRKFLPRIFAIWHDMDATP